MTWDKYKYVINVSYSQLSSSSSSQQFSLLWPQKNKYKHCKKSFDKFPFLFWISKTGSSKLIILDVSFNLDPNNTQISICCFWVNVLVPTNNRPGSPALNYYYRIGYSSQALKRTTSCPMVPATHDADLNQKLYLANDHIRPYSWATLGNRPVVQSVCLIFLREAQSSFFHP